MDISRFRRTLNGVAVKYKNQIAFLFVLASAFTAVVSRVVDRHEGGRWILNLRLEILTYYFTLQFYPSIFVDKNL